MAQYHFDFSWRSNRMTLIQADMFVISSNDP